MYKSARLHTPLFEGAEARSAFEAAYTPQQSKVERRVKQSRLSESDAIRCNRLLVLSAQFSWSEIPGELVFVLSV